MNNQAELIKLLLFAAPVVLWILGQLFNREGAQNLNRKPLGPRQGGGLPPAPRPRDARDGPTMRFPDAQKRDSFGEQGLPNRDEEVIILSTETRRAPVRPGGPRGRAVRRSRPPQPVPPPREPASSRPIGDGISLTMTPLPSVTPAPLPSSPRPAPTAAPTPTPLYPTTESLRAAVMSPQRLREAFLLNELLKPPLSQRRTGRGL